MAREFTADMLKFTRESHQPDPEGADSCMREYPCFVPELCDAYEALLTERDAARRDAYREAEELVRPWLFKVPYEQRPAMRELLDDLHRRATTAPGA